MSAVETEEVDGDETESSQLLPQTGREREAETTPKKKRVARNDSVGLGLSPQDTKKLRCNVICKDCQTLFTNKILLRIHKLKKCGEKSNVSIGPAPEVIDFSKLNLFNGAEIDVVAYVKYVQPVIKLGPDHFRFRLTIADKNGKCVYLYWTVKNGMGMKDLGVQARVSQKKIEVVAMENLNKVLLQAMVIGPVLVRKHSFTSAFGQHNLSFTPDTKFRACKEEDNDFDRLNPNRKHWGVPSNPLSAIDCKLELFAPKKTYDLIAFIESIQMSSKKYTNTWDTRTVVTQRVFGKMLVWLGFDAHGRSVFKSFRFTIFVEVTSNVKGPWPVHTPAGVMNFGYVRNKTVVLRAKYDDGLRNEKDYGPSWMIDKATDMSDVLGIKVSVF